MKKLLEKSITLWWYIHEISIVSDLFLIYFTYDINNFASWN